MNRPLLPFTLASLLLCAAAAAPADPNPTIRITALDDATGKPIPVFKARTLIKTTDVTVTILRKGADGKCESQLPTSGDSYTLQIEADGYMPAESAPLTPQNGFLQFDARLKKGNLFGGVILQPDGKPAANASVILKDSKYAMPIENGHLRAQSFEQGTIAKTDAAGQYAFPSQKGPLRALVLHDSGWAEINTDGSAPPADITLHAWAKVEGRLLQGGKPQAGKTVLLMPVISRPQNSQELPLRVNFQNYHTTTDAEGRFSFDHVVDGQSRFSVQYGHIQKGTISSGFEMTLDLKPGEQRTLALGGTGRPVIGHALLADELKDKNRSLDYGTLRLVAPQFPQPENWFTLPPDEKRRLTDAFHQTDAWKAYVSHPNAYPVAISPDGSFRADDVPAGTYVLDIVLQANTPEQPSAYRMIASGALGVTVPDMPGGKSTDPLDAGTVEVRAHNFPNAGDPAPVFQAQTYDGKTLNLSDFRGKFVLIDFWATWCGPCIARMPHLAELQKNIADAGFGDKFVILSISVDDRIDEPKRFLESHKYPWTQAFAGTLAASPARLAFGVQGIPSLWFIGPDGKIIAHNIVDSSAEQLQLLTPEGKRTNKPFSDDLLDQTIKQSINPLP